MFSKKCSAEFFAKEIDYQQRLADRLNSVSVESTDGIDCPICGNKKIIHKVEIDEQGYPMTVVYSCECVKKRRIVYNARKSGLDSLLGTKLKDFIVTEDWQQKAKQTAVDYLNDRSTSDWFVMVGQPGAGKTLLCSIVASQRLREGKVVEYFSWPEIMRVANSAWYEDPEVLRKYKEVEVLFLDDFLKSGHDNRSLDVAYQILNYRYNRKLPTIISGEKQITELMTIDQALASRIKERAGKYLINLGTDEKRNQRLKDEEERK